MNSDSGVVLVTLVLYNAALVGIGLWAARRTHSLDDFFIGGRGLGPVVAGLAYSASTSSAWVLLGFSGFVYATGVSALWMVPGILLGYLAAWLWAGRRLQEVARARRYVTLIDFLSGEADGWQAVAIRTIAALFIIVAFSFYVAAQFQGAGKAFDEIFGTGPAVGILIGAAIIVGYTFLGGFLAVSLTDTLQGLLIAAVAVLLPAFAWQAAGGGEGVRAALADAGTGLVMPFGNRTGLVAAGFALGLFATGFGALGQPHLLNWIMAARDRRARLQGAAVAFSWGALVYTGMAVLGLSARVIFGADAPAEGVFFRLSQDLLPPVFGGVVVAAMLSAIMSTVDSQLLVTSAAVCHDLRASRLLPRHTMLISRLTVLVVAALAIALTLYLPATIFERVLFAWTALGAAFGPTVVARAAGLHPGGTTVLLALVAGFGTALGFSYGWESGPGAVWERTLPWCAGFFVIAAGTLIPRSKRHVEGPPARLH